MEKVVFRNYLRELITASFENRCPSPLPDGITTDMIIDVARSNHMFKMLLESLIKISDDKEKVEKMQHVLKISQHKAFFQNIEIRMISQALENNGIKHQILKGGVLRFMYPAPEYREMSDIDIVVYDDSLEKTTSVMEGIGYVNKGLIKHHVIFKKRNGVIAEIHWCLYDRNVDRSQYIYYKDTFRSKLSKGKNYTYEFGKEDFYIYMISHMAKHFFETGCGIRNLVDIYIYWTRFEKDMDKEYLSDELKKCGTFVFEKKMRELSFIWMEQKECPEFFENLFSYMLDSGIYGKSENGIWSQLAKETVDGSSNLKMHYYFPSLKFMREKYQWLEKMPFLLPVAWGVRGICGMFSRQSREHKKEFTGADAVKTKEMLDIYHGLQLDFRR